MIKADDFKGLPQRSDCPADLSMTVRCNNHSPCASSTGRKDPIHSSVNSPDRNTTDNKLFLKLGMCVSGKA